MCQIDWPITAAIIQALSGIIIALAAFTGVKAWKQEIIGKRKLEITEECLTAFHKAKDILSYVRNGFANTGEGKFETTVTNEDLRSVAFSYNTPAVRLIREQDFFLSLKALEYKFRAIHGNIADTWFESIFRAQREILIASQTLARQAIRGDLERNPEFIRNMEIKIWADYASIYERPDPFIEDIESSISQMDVLFKKVIK